MGDEPIGYVSVEPRKPKKKIEACGPAFPRTACMGEEAEVWDRGTGGMTLRDYLAAQALLIVPTLYKSERFTLEGVAEAAYGIADAMMEARKK